MDENIGEINKRVIKHRKLAGFTQSQVAEHLNMKRNTYARMEKYGTIPPQTVKVIAKLFGVSVIDLLYGEETPNFAINTPQIKLEQPNLFDTSDILPLNVMEANGIRIFRNLPKDKADEVVEFLNRKYQESKHTVKPFDIK